MSYSKFINICANIKMWYQKYEEIFVVICVLEVTSILLASMFQAHDLLDDFLYAHLFVYGIIGIFLVLMGSILWISDHTRNFRHNVDEVIKAKEQ